MWAFECALTDSRSAADDEGRITALQRAATHYRGDLLKTSYYEWVEPTRARLQGQVLDALAQLAKLHEAAADFEGALDDLEQAPSSSSRIARSGWVWVA